MEEKNPVQSHDQTAFASPMPEGDSLTASKVPPSPVPTAGPPDPNLGKGGQEAAAVEATPAEAPKREKATEPKRLQRITVSGIPQEVVDELAAKEGIRLDVYADSKGLLTVGLGHRLTPDELKLYSKGDLFTEAEISALAAKDMGTAWKAAERQASELKVQDREFAHALFEVAFQLGTQWNTVHKKTWALMKAHDWNGAAKEVQNSQWYSQTPKRVEAFQSALNNLAAKEASGGKPVTEGGSVLDMMKAMIGEKKEQAPSAPPMPQGKQAVIAAQKILTEKGLFKGKIDGVAKRGDGKESQTQAAIKAFQCRNGLRETGELDTDTWAALHRPEVSFFSGPVGKEAPKAAGEEKQESLMDMFNRMTAKALAKETAKPAKKGWIYGPFLEGQEAFVTQLAPEQREAGIQGLTEEEAKSSSGVVSYKTSCKRACNKMMEKAGFRSLGSGTEAYGILDASTGDLAATRAKALEVLEENLQAGRPLIVGVHHKKDGANDYNMRGGIKTETDHYVVVVGKGQDSKGVYYAYFDPGRGNSEGYNLDKNRLYVGRGPDENKNEVAKEGWIGDVAYSGKYYSMSEVRPSTEIKEKAQ